MSLQNTRVRSSALAVLVVLVMLSSAVAVMASRTTGTPAASSGTPGASGVRAQLVPSAACGQLPVDLRSASTYAALSGTSVTNTGATALTGDLGVSPGSSVTGFPPGTVSGTKNVANPAAAGAEANLTLAYSDAAGRVNCPVTVAGNIGGKTLTPGLYKSTSSLAISSGDLTLSGGGNPNGVFIFQVASALTTTSGRAVILSNGAQAGNVFWQVGSSATIGTTSTMQGTIMAYASITMLAGSHLNGRALAKTGDVTLSATTIVSPTVTTSTTYTVTFTESNLPAGTPWSATLADLQMSSTATTIAFTAANGTYAFTAGTTADFAANPASGNLPVAGGDVNKAITFTASGGPGIFGVKFKETGLATSTNWSVTLNGVLKSSTTATIAFTVANGTYAYAVGDVTGYTATPSSANVVVNGVLLVEAIEFTAGGPGTYGVTFTETGLPSGTSWSVSFNGILKNSATATIVFNSTNGTNNYTVGDVSGYTASPSASTVTVNGATVNQAVTFTSTSGGGGGSSSAYSLPPWGWILIAILAIAIIAAIVAAIAMRRRRKPAT